METLESSRVCRLCGKQSGISINIFDKNENHVKKISAVLPIMVHEMDLLPKHMCHRCSYKLEEFHKFYIDCLKTDADLKSQLSWMRKEDSKERVGVPMVHIENIKIKVEPPDYDAYEMDPMVDNVGYIKSMSSVTFPVNGVRSKDISKGMAYATYAHCDCYCDKADQSNSNVPTNFDNRISRCNRLEDVKSEEFDEDNRSQTVPSTFLADEPFGERSTMGKISGEAENSRNCEPTSSVLSLANSKLVNVPRTPMVRNLRPRNRSVDYVGVKRKLKVSPVPSLNAVIGMETQSKASSATMLAATQIKVEKLDDGLTRVLRPRKGTIDYIGPKRKYSKSRSKVVQRTQGENRRSNKATVRNIARQLKLSTKGMSKLAENRIQVTIKEEQISDLEDYRLVESSQNQVITSIGDLMANQIDKLPINGSGSLRNNRVNCSTFNDAQPSSNFSIASSTWKLLRNSPKSKLKSREFRMSRVAAMNHSPRYLRSQDVYLRSGRIRKLDAVNASARKLQRSLRNLTKRGETTAKNLMKVIRDTVTVKNIPGGMKLIDNIKHYCEECNTSFANKELFKLHACYGH